MKVYAVNIHELKEGIKDTIDSIGWHSIPDWEFIEIAEDQGNVWSLSNFELAFNKEEINTDMFYIRIR
jgi:hypothetical protein